MVYKTDLEEMKMHSIEHYYQTMMDNAEKGHEGVVRHMYSLLSDTQKKDLIDFIDKKNANSSGFISRKNDRN
jgi:hypothetical protein